jgi:tetrahydromethanopterin S-methyltransferase subunit E
MPAPKKKSPVKQDMSSKVVPFVGSLVIIGFAIAIFFMLMSTEMPQSNRELLISFVSVIFGSMAGSIKKITGDS